MGAKRTRTRQYVLFYLASLICLLLLNCATIKDITQGREAREYLLRGNRLLAEKDYEGALREYQKVISMPAAKSEEAEALFGLGLTYAHFGNPKRDYDRSIYFFIRVLNDHPESPLVEQARIWVGVLQENKRASQMIERAKQAAQEAEKPRQPETKPEGPGAAREYLVRGQKLLLQGDYEGSIKENQKVLSMATHRPPEDEALLNLGLIYAHSGNPRRDYGKAIEFFQRLIKEHPRSPLVEQARIWVEVLKESEELTQVIQKLKQVDIDVEEKKREKTK